MAGEKAPPPLPIGLPPTPPPRPVLPPLPDDPTGTFALGAIMQHLGTDPKHRRTILSMIREASPHTPIPELDVTREVETRLDADRKARDDKDADRDKRLAAIEAADRRRLWMESNGIADDDEMKAIEKLAADEGITKPDTALKYYRQAEIGRPRATGGIDSITEESRKLLFSNPKAWALQEGAKVQHQMRRRAGRG